MVVQDDLWDYCDGCSNTVRRRTTYKVVNSYGSAAKNIPLGEVNDYGTSTCYEGRHSVFMNSCTIPLGDPIPNPSGDPANTSDGMWATDSNGTFIDGWTMVIDGFSPSGCGFHVNYDHWQLCGLGKPQGNNLVNVGLTFATLTGFYHTNQVGINVGTTQRILPLYFAPCPPGTSGCLGSIPIGTEFTP